jgi:ubiquinone/menaquinone biosynthesis C-methylase UbiE
MSTGHLDPWRTSSQLDRDGLRDMAQMIEQRGQAPEEIAARQTYLDLLQLASGQRVLDVGCGTGVVTRALAQRVQPHGTVIGLDPRPEFLELAAELTSDNSTEFRQGDALALPFDAHSFDAVVCITVLEHMPSPELAINELVRVTRTGGRVGVLCGDQESFVVNHPDRALTRRIINAHVDARFASPWIGRAVPSLLERAGVTQVQVRGLPTLDRDPTGYGGQAVRSRAEFAVQAGAISASERDQWLAQLDTNPASFLAGATYIFSWGVA